MTTNTMPAFDWAPRIAGVAMALFLGVFALDAFEGKPFFEALPGFVVHLAPSFVVLAAVALAWRRPIVGAVAFPALALAYAVLVHWRLDWIAAIGSPLIVVGVLFLVSWWRGRGSRREQIW